MLGVSTIELTIHAWRDLPGMAIGVVKAGRSRYGWASADAIDEPLTGTIGELIEFVRVHERVDRARRVVGGRCDPGSGADRALLSRQLRTGCVAPGRWPGWGGSAGGRAILILDDPRPCLPASD